MQLQILTRYDYQLGCELINGAFGGLPESAFGAGSGPRSPKVVLPKSAISDHSSGGRCRADSRPISVGSGGTTRWHGNRRSGFKPTPSAQLICLAIHASKVPLAIIVLGDDAGQIRAPSRLEVAAQQDGMAIADPG